MRRPPSRGIRANSRGFAECEPVERLKVDRSLVARNVADSVRRMRTSHAYDFLTAPGRGMQVITCERRDCSSERSGSPERWKKTVFLPRMQVSRRDSILRGNQCGQERGQMTDSTTRGGLNTVVTLQLRGLTGALARASAAT
jgi:hypothetical protein